MHGDVHRICNLLGQKPYFVRVDLNDAIKFSLSSRGR